MERRAWLTTFRGLGPREWILKPQVTRMKAKNRVYKAKLDGRYTFTVTWIPLQFNPCSNKGASWLFALTCFLSLDVVFLQFKANYTIQLLDHPPGIALHRMGFTLAKVPIGCSTSSKKCRASTDEWFNEDCLGIYLGCEHCTTVFLDRQFSLIVGKLFIHLI